MTSMRFFYRRKANYLKRADVKIIAACKIISFGDIIFTCSDITSTIPNDFSFLSLAVEGKKGEENLLAQEGKRSYSEFDLFIDVLMNQEKRKTDIFLNML